MTQCTTDRQVKTLSAKMMKRQESRPVYNVSHQKYLETLPTKTLNKKAGDHSFLFPEVGQGLHPRHFHCHHNPEKCHLAISHWLARGVMALLAKGAIALLVLQVKGEMILLALALQALALLAPALQLDKVGGQGRIFEEQECQLLGREQGWLQGNKKAEEAR